MTPKAFLCICESNIALVVIGFKCTSPGEDNEFERKPFVLSSCKQTLDLHSDSDQPILSDVRYQWDLSFKETFGKSKHTQASIPRKLTLSKIKERTRRHRAACVTDSWMKNAKIMSIA